MAKIKFADEIENITTRKEFPLSKAQDVLKDEVVAVLGYGVQGPAQSLNMRDNGVNVIVGQRKSDKPNSSWQRAINDGWVPGKTLFDIETAAEKGTIVMMLTSDASIKPVFKQIRKHLTPERTAWLKERGYALPKTAAELRDAKGKIFGLFANDTMTAMVERRSGKPCDEPTLPEMAGKALEILSQDPDGFFLLIEGAQVDHGAHVHDLPWSVYELLTFDETVAQVLAFAEKNPDTVVLIAPDHETGGLTLCTTEPKEGARAEVIRATTSKRGKGVSSKDWFVKYTTGGHTGVDVFLAGNNRDVRPYLNCEFPKAIAGRDAERLPELQGKTVEADGATWLETADGKRLRANLDAIYVKDTGKWYARP